MSERRAVLTVDLDCKKCGGQALFWGNRWPGATLCPCVGVREVHVSAIQRDVWEHPVALTKPRETTSPPERRSAMGTTDDDCAPLGSARMVEEPTHE